MRETAAQRRQRLQASPQDVAALLALVDGPLQRMRNEAKSASVSATSPTTTDASAATQAPTAAGGRMDAHAGYLRWFTLVAMNVARPVGVRAALIASVLRAVDRSVDDERAERLFQELARMGLVTLHGPIRGGLALLTKQGVDVVEYSAPAPASIARPGPN